MVLSFTFKDNCNCVNYLPFDCTDLRGFEQRFIKTENVNLETKSRLNFLLNENATTSIQHNLKGIQYHHFIFKYRNKRRIGGKTGNSISKFSMSI